MAYVVREQVYRDINTGKVSQIRQEMSNGDVQWEYDGAVHYQPRITSAEAQRRELELARERS